MSTLPRTHDDEAIEIKPTAKLAEPTGLSTAFEQAPHAPEWLTTIAADRCSWAIIEPAALSTPAPSLAALRQMVRARSPALNQCLQRWVPVPVEQLHAAYILIEPVALGEPALVVACAVERELLDSLPEGTLAAAPATLPAALHARLGNRAPSAASLNLLVGEFQPRPLRIAHRRTRVIAAASLVLLLGLLALGLARRAEHEHNRAQSLLAAASAVELRAAPRESLRPNDPARARLLLAGEIARLRSARTGPPEMRLDAAATLADLLARWPRSEPDVEVGKADARSPLYARLQSVQVVATGITLTVLLPADADPEPILAALRALEGWQLQPTQRSSAPPVPGSLGKPEARLTLRLVPVAKPTSPARAS